MRYGVNSLNFKTRPWISDEHSNANKLCLNKIEFSAKFPHRLVSTLEKYRYQRLSDTDHTTLEIIVLSLLLDMKIKT